MSLNNPLANVLAHVMNCEKIGRRECLVSPVSKVIMKVLQIMNQKGYLGEAVIVEKARGGSIKIPLLGNINKCGVTPKFNIQIEEYTKFEKRYLPARDFGVLIVSTDKGIMTHNEAKEKHLGGRLVAYCY